MAIAVVSKTQYFTKTHIKFLEWFFYTEAAKAGRYKLENPTVPTKPHISESMEADLLDNSETIRLLVATLGYPIFDHIKKPPKKGMLTCKGKAALAQGEYTEDGFVVFAGSKCNVKEAKSAGPYVKRWRQQLIEDGTLAKDGELYRFTEDHIFSSPNTAASVVLARRANGWTQWKYENGKTLDEVIRRGKE